MIEEHQPKILARFNLPDNYVPVRAYLHKAGLKVWDPDLRIRTDYDIMGQVPINEALDVAKDHLINTLRGIKSDASQFDYLLAVLWARPLKKDSASFDKMIDFFGYSDIPKNANDWPGNPDIEGWVMKNEVYAPMEGIVPGGLTCGDVSIVIGEEEKYRRTCKDLNEFLQNPPDIEGLEYLTKVLG